MCGVEDPNEVSEASARCDELGLDTISAGGAIAWAIECAERGCSTRPGCVSATATAVRRTLDEIVEGTEGWVRCSPWARRPRARRGSGARRGVARAREGPRAARLRPAHAARDGPRPRGSTPAEPTATGRASTRPTSGGDLDRLDGGAAHGPRCGRDRGPGRGDGLADPMQVPARRVRRPVRPSGRSCSPWSPVGTSTPPSCTATAGRIVATKRAYNIREGWTPADDWLPARLLDGTGTLRSGRVGGSDPPPGCGP